MTNFKPLCFGFVREQVLLWGRRADIAFTSRHCVRFQFRNYLASKPTPKSTSFCATCQRNKESKTCVLACCNKSKQKRQEAAMGIRFQSTTGRKVAHPLCHHAMHIIQTPPIYVWLQCQTMMWSTCQRWCGNRLWALPGCRLADRQAGWQTDVINCDEQPKKATNKSTNDDRTTNHDLTDDGGDATTTPANKPPNSKLPPSKERRNQEITKSPKSRNHRPSSKFQKSKNQKIKKSKNQRSKG